MNEKQEKIWPIILKGINLIPGAFLVLEINREALYTEPHVDIPHYSNRNESVGYIVSGFNETIVIEGVTMPPIIL